MRSQWCREHIDETAEHCGIDESTVSEVKQAAQFCVDHSEYSDCSTMAILVLIRYPDMAIRDNAILSIRKSFDSGKHPLTGKITKSKILTAKEVKKILEKEEIALRGEVVKEIKKEKKTEPITMSEGTETVTFQKEPTKEEFFFPTKKPFDGSGSSAPQKGSIPVTKDPPIQPLSETRKEELAASKAKTPEQITKEKAEILDYAVDALLNLLASRFREIIKTKRANHPREFHAQADVITMALDFFSEKWKP